VSHICTVEFPDGWKLSLRALYTQATYADYDGAPHSAVNNSRIQQILKKAAGLFPGSPIHVVEPERVLGRRIDSLPRDHPALYREYLPSIACIGAFEANVVPGADGCASGLVVVWFQGTPPPVPIEPNLVDMFGDIQWDDLAANYWF
jgi:hypothetical protein